MKRILATTLLLATSAFAQNDADYTSQIQKFTTGPQFTTELVDHLPASATVPTPLKFLGYIAGAEGHLTYAEDVDRYMRALREVIERKGAFCALYSDRASHFLATPQAGGNGQLARLVIPGAAG